MFSVLKIQGRLEAVDFEPIHCRKSFSKGLNGGPLWEGAVGIYISRQYQSVAIWERLLVLGQGIQSSLN